MARPKGDTQPPPAASTTPGDAPGAGDQDTASQENGGDQENGDQGGGEQATKPPAAAPATPRDRTFADDILPERHGREKDPIARRLLLQVCEMFGVNPSQTARPAELAAWFYYPAVPLEDIPAAVHIVTHGGKKLKVFADLTVPQETVAQLAGVFGLQVKPDLTADLPDNLTLPAQAVTGLSGKGDHRYEGGYLKSGGKKEADRRQALKAKK